MRSLFFVPVSGDVDVAPAFPLPGEPVAPVRGDGDDGGVPRHSLWRKAGAPPGCGQQRGFEPRHVGEVPVGQSGAASTSSLRPQSKSTLRLVAGAPAVTFLASEALTIHQSASALQRRAGR